MSKKKKIDLTDIKKYDLDETASFTDLMTKKERENRKNRIVDSNDIDDMINEKRKNTNTLTEQLEKAKEEYVEEVLVEEIKPKENKKIEKNIKLKDIENIEDNLGKTQIMELTRAMKFNFNEKKEENNMKKKHGISPLNIVGELNLFCMGYYIYLLAFTNYQDIESRYMLNGGIIILMVLLFGLSVVTPKKVSKVFHIINIIVIIAFLIYNAYTLMY